MGYSFPQKVLVAGVGFLKGRPPLKSRIRRIQQASRRRKKEEKRREIGYVKTIAKLLRQTGYRKAVVADHVSRLRLSRGALSYLIKLERTSIADLQLSALTGSGLFSLRGATARGKRVAREVLEALIEFNQNNLRLLEDSRSHLARD